MTTTGPQDDFNSELTDMVKATLQQSGNCAQTAFAVLQEALDLGGDEILKALTPFPGIALRGETCGAVTGCLMALGLVYGRDELDDWRRYIASLPSARRFCRRFAEQHGSTMCGGILEVKLGRSYDLADRTQALEYAAAGGAEACAEVVAAAVHIAAELIVKGASRNPGSADGC